MFFVLFFLIASGLNSGCNFSKPSRRVVSDFVGVVGGANKEVFSKLSQPDLCASGAQITPPLEASLDVLSSDRLSVLASYKIGLIANFLCCDNSVTKCGLLRLIKMYNELMDLFVALSSNDDVAACYLYIAESYSDLVALAANDEERFVFLFNKAVSLFLAAEHYKKAERSRGFCVEALNLLRTLCDQFPDNEEVFEWFLSAFRLHCEIEEHLGLKH